MRFRGCIRWVRKGGQGHLKPFLEDNSRCHNQEHAAVRAPPLGSWAKLRLNLQARKAALAHPP